jgi:hypothetical protein
MCLAWLLVALTPLRSAVLLYDALCVLLQAAHWLVS